MKNSDGKQKIKKKVSSKLFPKEVEKKEEQQKPENEIQEMEEEQQKPENKLQEMENKLKESQNKYLYLKAEFENYKKQIEKKHKSFLRYAGENVILTFIDEIIDDFERAFEIYNQEKSLPNFKKGMDIVYKKLQKVLQNLGLEAIDPTGTLFDPNQQEAIGRQQSSDVPENHIIITFKKIYKLYGKVIRHGQVIISEKNKDTNSDQ